MKKDLNLDERNLSSKPLSSLELLLRNTRKSYLECQTQITYLINELQVAVNYSTLFLMCLPSTEFV